MSRRLAILIAIIAVGLGLIGLILWWLSGLQQPPVDQPANENVNQAPVNANVNAPNLNLNAPPITPQPTETEINVQTRDELKRLGIIFGERFGSFSSQSELENFTELYPVMTSQMRNWTEGYVADLRREYSTIEGYAGVSTRAISSIFTNFDPTAGKAELTLTTQREQINGIGSRPDIYYQDLNLIFLRESDGLWRVQGAFWLLDQRPS